jgi:hypothetical protein
MRNFVLNIVLMVLIVLSLIVIGSSQRQFPFQQYSKHDIYLLFLLLQQQNRLCTLLYSLWWRWYDDTVSHVQLWYNDILLAIRVSHNETINISESCTRMKERKKWNKWVLLMVIITHQSRNKSCQIAPIGDAPPPSLSSLSPMLFPSSKNT